MYVWLKRYKINILTYVHWSGCKKLNFVIFRRTPN